jgi:hypothetical protein
MNMEESLRSSVQCVKPNRGARMAALMAAVLGIAVMSTASATYNANIAGIPTEVVAYEGGVVLFVLNTQPTSNGSCNAALFEIDPANNTDAVLARMYARLLLASAQQEAITIGYDNAGSCGSSGYIHVYRVG